MNRLRWIAVLAICIVAAGARSLQRGKDASWDLKNYHFYNAHAFLHDRMSFDVAPAQLQSYHYPFVELPFYWLVKTFDEPRVVAFLMALPAAVAAFFLLRILLLLFPPEREGRISFAWIGVAATIGLTGTAGTAAWGSTMNEWPSTALVMAALWTTVRAQVDGRASQLRPAVIAGVFMGCAVALKLTYGVFAVGFAAACLVHGTLQDRIRRVAACVLGMGVGFLVLYGPWGLILWREFENPFFPYFNAIFQSPWWEPISFFDPNFGPRTWQQWLFFPLFFAREYKLVGEISFRDWRLATLLVLATLSAALLGWRALKARSSPQQPIPRDATPWPFLAVFALVSYVVWLKMFGIYRYLVVLEVVSGALIVACVLHLAQRRRTQVIVLAVLTTLLIGTTRHGGGWGRLDFGDRYFDVDPPPIAANALVLIGYVHPMAYAVPFFPPETRFVSAANNFLAVDQRNKLEQRAAEAVRSHSGPLYFLQHRKRDPQDEITLDHFKLRLVESGCATVKSSFEANRMTLCPLIRG